jgi:hypothetical protein
MKQKKLDIKLAWGDPMDDSTVPSRVVTIQSCSNPEWQVELNEAEFLEFAELIYVEYCKTRRRNGVRNQPNVGISGSESAYFISLQMYSELLPTALGEAQKEALRRLLAVSGTREDLMMIKRLCSLSQQHGYYACIACMLEEAGS